MNSRYELKYLVSPEQALRIRDFVREYLDFDEHSVGKSDYSYPVHTLHLDSGDWELYWRTIRGDHYRWKLRVRYYSSHPDSPVYFEVLHQKDDIVSKYRAGVRLEAVNALLGGCLPEMEQLFSKNPDEAVALHRFGEMMHEFHARPRLHLFWMREAYESDDAGARVTLDRRICASMVSGDFGGLLPVAMENPLMCVHHLVILQLRFTERFPDWYRELVQVFNLGDPVSWSEDDAMISCDRPQLTADDILFNIVL
jgi:hypothetical protein